MTIRSMVHAACAACLLSLAAACASVAPDPPVLQPQVVETQPATPPAAEPVTEESTSAAAPQPAPAGVAAPSTTTPPVAAAAPVAPDSTTAVAPRSVPAVVPAPRGSAAASPVPGKVATPATKAPAAPAPTPVAPRAVTPPSPAAPVTLDVKTLTEQLRATKAIGVFTKLSLKNKVDDLLEQFREHYSGKPTPTMAELRQFYNLLMMKVLSLLQDNDQKLASAIVASREAIWSLLANPQTFATLQS